MEWIDSYYSRDYLKEIESLKKQLKENEEWVNELDNETEVLNQELVNLKKELLSLKEPEVQEPDWLINHMKYKPRRRFVSKTKDVTIIFQKPQHCFDKSTLLYELLKENNLLKVEKTYDNMKKVMKLMKDRKINFSEMNAIVDQIKHPNSKVEVYKHYWSNKHIKIGLGSDTHIGSNYDNIQYLEDAFKRFEKDKVDAVYLVGDITEGYNMRPGHSFECYLHGADAQIDGTVEKIPDINRPIYFITGDHDYSHFKRQQIDIGKHIAERRKDLNYLGMSIADILLTPKTKLRLIHPKKGTAYALSYHTQKMIDSFSGGDKPNILAVGHYHKIEYLFYRNVHAFQAGCFQNQTSWMKQMNIAAMQGAWIIDIYIKRNGTIDKLEMKMLPYY